MRRHRKGFVSLTALQSMCKGLRGSDRPALLNSVSVGASASCVTRTARPSSTWPRRTSSAKRCRMLWPSVFCRGRVCQTILGHVLLHCKGWARWLRALIMRSAWAASSVRVQCPGKPTFWSQRFALAGHGSVSVAFIWELAT